MQCAHCAILLGQGLEGRLGLARPVRHRQRRDVDLHRPPDCIDMRHHGADAANAVEPDDVGAERLDALRRFGRRKAVAHLALLVQREGDDRGQLRLPDHVERDLGLAEPGDRLGDDEVDAGLDRPGDLLLEHGAHLARRVRVVRACRRWCCRCCRRRARRLRPRPSWRWRAPGGSSARGRPRGR